MKEYETKKSLHLIKIQGFDVLKAEWTGLEPATSCVTGRRSNQLNYHSVSALLLKRCKSRFILFRMQMVLFNNV